MRDPNAVTGVKYNPGLAGRSLNRHWMGTVFSPMNQHHRLVTPVSKASDRSRLSFDDGASLRGAVSLILNGGFLFGKIEPIGHWQMPDLCE
jgi:hypothetical protein